MEPSPPGLMNASWDHESEKSDPWTGTFTLRIGELYARASIVSGDMIPPSSQAKNRIPVLQHLEAPRKAHRWLTTAPTSVTIPAHQRASAGPSDMLCCDEAPAQSDL
jgi:hypothetical protein